MGGREFSLYCSKKANGRKGITILKKEQWAKGKETKIMGEGNPINFVNFPLII